MIAKQRDPLPEASEADKRRQAGARAEDQAAFYMHRAFADEPNIHVVHDLRLVDPEQPNPDGSPGVAQIDHLIVHRRAVFIIESKSAVGTMTVTHDGSGGDLWDRSYKRRRQGLQSPIQQARQQGEFLRNLLQRNREMLLGKIPIGTRTLSKVLAGTDNRGFSHLPIHVIVAVSDRGAVQFKNNWKPKAKPFNPHVTKADQVPQKVLDELKRHDGGLLHKREPEDPYGRWSMKREEAVDVVRFLLRMHTPAARPPEPPPLPAPEQQPIPTPEPARPSAPASSSPTCRKCGGTELQPKPGKRGLSPYWKCACGGNTPMSHTCAACGHEGSHKAGDVPIHHVDGEFVRKCSKCGLSEVVAARQS